MPRLRTKFEVQAFSHAVPTAWNSLPLDMHSASSLAVFQKLLKMHFIILHFLDINLRC